LIRWRPSAEAQRAEQLEYIAADNPVAAMGQDELITEQVRQLLAQPRMGRPGRVKGTRELVISKTPFIVIYRVQGGQIEILNFVHGAQQWPPEK
jgi:toxin ParE1/3/4